MTELTDYKRIVEKPLKEQRDKYRNALEMIGDAQFVPTDAVRGLMWCQELAREILKS